MSHGFSPTMQRVLRTMRARHSAGSVLRYSELTKTFSWKNGSTLRPANGIRRSTIEALLRRSAIYVAGRSFPRFVDYAPRHWEKNR